MSDVEASRWLPAREGFAVKVQLIPDTFCDPWDDSDMFTDEQIAGWQRGEWRYVGLRVVASMDGVELGEASLWSIQDGTIALEDGDSVYVDPFHDPDYVDELAAEAVDEARRTLDRLCGAAAKAAL